MNLQYNPYRNLQIFWQTREWAGQAAAAAEPGTAPQAFFILGEDAVEGEQQEPLCPAPE
jgi:hypothetical protein